MSDQQPPLPPPPPPTGGSNVPPTQSWTPTPLSAAGQASYVGRSGGPGPATPQQSSDPAINRFAPKRSLAPLVIALVTILIAAGVVYVALNPTKPEPAAITTPTPSVSSPARPGTPFAVAYSDTAGVWQITKHQWSERGLDIFVEVTVDTGTIECRFNALSNSGREAKDARTSQLTPGFSPDIMVSGDKRSGWLNLPISERDTVLVFLHTPGQGQVSGIEVSG